MSIKAAVASVFYYLRDNYTIRWLALPFLLFFILALIFPAVFLIKWLSWILVVVAVGVVSTYIVAVWNGLLRSGPMPQYTHLAIGIFLAWTGVVMTRTWSGVIRLYPLETWMRESYFIAFYIWTTLMAGIFHMTAPGAIDGVVPTMNWIKIGIAVMIGILLGVVISAFLFGTELTGAGVDFDLLSYLVSVS